jgi:hypothetical protein
MLLRPDVIVVLLATMLLLPRRGIDMCTKCECSLPIFGLLSYLPGISSGETDGALVTSGEAEFYPRWETLREKPRFKRYLGCFPSGVSSLLI